MPSPILISNLSNEEISALANQAIAESNGDLDALCLIIQERIGVESGDLAGLLWSGEEDRLNDHDFVTAYIRSEINSVNINRVCTVDGIREWFAALNDAEIAFHPEESFANFVSRDGTPSFDPKTADLLDNVMEYARDIAKESGLDICEIALEVAA